MTPTPRLRIAAYAAYCPAIEPLRDICREQEPGVRIRFEHILWTILCTLPHAPKSIEADLVRHLYRCPFEEILRTMALQRRRSSRDRLILDASGRTWSHVRDPSEREFAQRCATIMSEAVHLQRAALLSAG